MKKRLSLIVALTLVLISLFTIAFSNKQVNAATLTDEEKVAQEIANINVPEKAIIDFPVVSESVYGSTIEWESSNTSILNVPQNGGWVTVTRPTDEDKTVTLTVTISLNGFTASDDFEVLVPKGVTQTNSYSISYELNGGVQNSANPTSYVVGTTPEVKAPTKGTVAFLGWYDNEEFEGSPITVLPKGLSGNYKLYAKWDVAVVERIEIVSNPAKLVYNALENFDPTGLEVKAYYNDTTDKMLTAAEIDAMNLDEIQLHADDTKVVVSFEGKEDEIAITVNKINFEMNVTFVSASKEYNGAPQSLAITGSLPQGLTVSYSGSATNVNEGEQTITATFGFDSNYPEYERDYNLPAAMNATLTITKATMTITADNKSMKVGAVVPAFTVTITGAKTEDDKALALSKVVLSSIGNSSSPAGDYDIEIDEFELDNYNVEIENGILAISDGTYSIDPDEVEFDFTGSKQMFTAKFKDGNEEISSVVLTYTVEGNTFDGAVNVGTYTVKVSYDDPTYGSGYEYVTMTIKAVQLQEDMFDDLPRVSHTGSPIEPKVNGKFGEYTLIEGVDYTLTYNANTAKGEADVIITPVANGNFDIEGSDDFVIKHFVIWESELERVTLTKAELEQDHSALNGKLNSLEKLTVNNATYEADIYWMSTSTALTVDAQGNVSVILAAQEQTVVVYAMIMAGNAAEYAMFEVVLPAMGTATNGDVSVEGVQSGVQVEVEVTDGLESGYVVSGDEEVIAGYDITLKQNNESVQPMSKVTVKLPVPAGYVAESLEVYYVAEGQAPVNMNAEVVDGFLVFDTDHFSKYIVVGVSDEPAQEESKEIVFEFGEDDPSKTDENNSSQDGSEYKGAEFTTENYTLVFTSYSKVYSGAYDAKGNACLKLGTGSAVGSFTFTVPNDVTSVVIKVTGYKAKTVGIKVNNETYTISTLSQDGEYTDVIVDTSSNKTITFTTTTNYRCKITSITFVTGTGSVTPDPEPTHTHIECPTCGLCTANDCDGAADDKCQGHEVVVPEIIEATVAEFLVAAESSTQWYKLTGVISNIKNTSYGNFDLTDESGTIYVYGLTATQVSSNNQTFASLGLKAGDVVTLIGTRTSYNGAPQVGGPAYYVSHEDAPHAHVECPTCGLCTANDCDGDADDKCQGHTVAGSEYKVMIATVRTTGGNYYIATSDLGTAGTKRYTAVDSGVSDPTKLPEPQDNQVWTIEATTGGYYLKASNGQYVCWTSGNSGNLTTDKSKALVLTIDYDADKNICNIHFTASDGERYFSLNGTSGNDYFAFYKGTQKQDLTLKQVNENNN